MVDMSPRHVIAKALNPHCLHDNVTKCPCVPGVIASRDADTVLHALEAAGYGVEKLPTVEPGDAHLDPAELAQPGPVLNMTDSDEQFEAGEQQ